jgi:uncharacterized membrane protein
LPTDDTLIDNVTGLLLRVGVLAAAVLLLIGGSVFLVRHHDEKEPDRTVFVPQPEEYSRPSAMWRAAREGRGRAIIQLGLLVLIATPLLRVAFSALAFTWRRDVVYVIIPLIVLAVLIAGLLTGQAG